MDLSPTLCVDCGTKLAKDKLQCLKCGRWHVDSGDSGRETEIVFLTDAVKQSIRFIPTGPEDICFGQDWETKEAGLSEVGVTLFGGGPGAGKSTWTIQKADRLVDALGGDVLIVSAEEGTAQINGRAMRLGLKNRNRIGVFEVKKSRSGSLAPTIRKLKPKAVIVDSITELAKDPQEQVLICQWFKAISTELCIPFIVIDQMTKDEDLSGLNQLLHAVDTIVTFTREPESAHASEELIRVMRTIKNRFGRENVEAYFEMTEGGLVYIGCSDTHGWSEDGPPFRIERYGA